MKTDIILSGVGGQGILSIATIIGEAATRMGLTLKQAEVHGMSQRGGDVQSNLRLSDTPIASDLIALGTADMILSLEPMEALRYLPYLAEDGWIITSSAPFKNIPNYPDEQALADELNAQPHVVSLDVERLAKENHVPRSANVILLGAAAAFLKILDVDALRESIGRGGGNELPCFRHRARLCEKLEPLSIMSSVFSKEQVAGVAREMKVADLQNATIGDVLLVASRLEEQTGIPFIRMDQGSPGLPANKVGIEAEKRALDAGLGAQYPAAAGVPELKEAASRFVKAFIDIDIPPRACVPTTGSVAASFGAFIACTQRIPGKTRFPGRAASGKIRKLYGKRRHCSRGLFQSEQSRMDMLGRRRTEDYRRACHPI